jgi:hypothetical protein
MKKRRTVKNNSVKKIATPSVNSSAKSATPKSPANDAKMEKILIENLISLQKVMVNLSEKFNKIGTQMERLLNLFEDSAKALAKKEFDMSKEEKEHKKILDQIDNLLEQNKTIARSLALMHEVTHGGEVEPEYPQPMQMPIIAQPPQQRPMPAPAHFPKFQPPMQQGFSGQAPVMQTGMPNKEEYQKSISVHREQTPLQQKMPLAEPTELYAGEEGNA